MKDNLPVIEAGLVRSGAFYGDIGFSRADILGTREDLITGAFMQAWSSIVKKGYIAANTDGTMLDGQAQAVKTLVVTPLGREAVGLAPLEPRSFTPKKVQPKNPHNAFNL